MKHDIQKLTLSALLLLTSLSVHAQTQPMPQPMTQSATSAAATAAPENQDREMQEEFNGYVKCLNRISGPVNRALDRYLAWVNEKTGPTCKESLITYGIYSLPKNDVEDCKKALERGISGAPSLPEIEKTFGDVVASFEGLAPLVNQAADYYTQQNYKDDQCAKAKEMHPKLVQDLKRFRELELQLHAKMDPLKNAIEERRLTTLEKSEGRKLAWNIKSVLLRARQLIETIPMDSNNIKSENYLPAFDHLEQAYTAFEQYASSAPADETKGLDGYYNLFRNSAKSFYTETKFIKRDLAEKKPIQGQQINKVIDIYNNLISHANMMKY